MSFSFEHWTMKMTDLKLMKSINWWSMNWWSVNWKSVILSSTFRTKIWERFNDFDSFQLQSLFKACSSGSHSNWNDASLREIGWKFHSSQNINSKSGKKKTKFERFYIFKLNITNVFWAHKHGSNTLNLAKPNNSDRSGTVFPKPIEIGARP